MSTPLTSIDHSTMRVFEQTKQRNEASSVVTALSSLGQANRLSDLLEAEVGGLLLEAVSADVQVVLASAISVRGVGDVNHEVTGTAPRRRIGIDGKRHLPYIGDLIVARCNAVVVSKENMTETRHRGE